MTSLNDQLLADAAKAISTAKVAVLTRAEFVFYSSIMMKLEIQFSDAIKTAATNGKAIIFNPQFIMDMPHAQRVFVLMHELMHVVYKHLTRLGGRNPKLWNIATDYVINNELDHLKFSVAPGALLDHKYDGMSADAIYAQIEEDHKNDPNSTPEPDHDDLLPLAPNDQDPLDKSIDKAIGEAMVRVQQAQRDGNSVHVPDAAKRYYEELMSPKVDWREALQQFLYGVAKTDYTYAKPSRRSHALGLYLPSLRGESMDCIDFAIDTSGSVSEEDFHQFVGEIHDIFETFQPEDIGIIQFDDSVRSSRRVASLEEFKDIPFVGGGGTEIGPVLKHFNDSDGKALVVLTDGYFYHHPHMEPSKPVIWAIYDNPDFQPHFGEAVHFSKDTLYDK